MAVDRALAPLGLTHAQYSLLSTLYGLSRSGGQPSQRRIADVSGLDPMYTSKLARALEHEGLIARADNPVDPRAVQLTFTDSGAAIVVEAMTIVREVQEKMLAPIGGASGAQSGALRDMLLALLHSPSEQEPAGM